MTATASGQYRSATYRRDARQVVSVVTPSYNQTAYLPATLESVLSQQGDFHLDHVVLDGASDDGSVEILREFEDGLRRGSNRPKCAGFQFRWLSRPDGGQSEAINKGFRIAEGGVLCWLNSDDLYADGAAVSRVAAFFDANPAAGFLYGRAYEINAEGASCGTHRVVIEYGIEDLLEIDYIIQPASFWRREVFDRVGPLNESMCFAFDWEYWMRVSEEYEFHFLNEFLACNRLYPENKSLSGGDARRKEIAQLLIDRGKLTDRSINAYLCSSQNMNVIKKGNPLVRGFL
ncbi:MAG: glycosyltransferase, partial [Planctomycetales bacterium]